jgi:glycosyltransferase involved in cell wall biosynthesis
LIAQPKISIIIPTFNEEKLGLLPKLLKQVSAIDSVEVICVDSDSTDNTKEVIKEFKAVLLNVKTNSRAKRQNEGIKIAKGEIIFLHHPRSIIDPMSLKYLIKNHSNIIWGGLTHRFDKSHYLLKFTSWYSNRIRAKFSSILYLDHCIFFRRDLLQNDLTPVPEVDIFEDTYFSIKLKKLSKVKPIILPFTSMTSAIRFESNGIWLQAIMNQILKICFKLHIPHKIMNKIYEKGLSLNSRYK